jgi:hypothetical protein
LAEPGQDIDIAILSYLIYYLKDCLAALLALLAFALVAGLVAFFPQVG